MYETPPPSFGWTRGERGGIHPEKGGSRFCEELGSLACFVQILREFPDDCRAILVSQGEFIARAEQISVACPNVYISDPRLPVFLSLFFFIFLEFSSFSQLAKLWRELSRSWWALRTFVAWTQTRCIIIAIAVSISKQVRRNDVALDFIFFLVFFFLRQWYLMMTMVFSWGVFFAVFVLRSSCGVSEFLGLGRRDIDWRRSGFRRTGGR